MKLIYLVLDGAADRLADKVTSYEQARKPLLDLLAKAGKCGMMYTVGKGIAPESDGAVMSILGYDPHKEYTGRGPIEAVGAGLTLKEGYEVAFRANFATVDPATYRLIDRRVGRSLRTEEAKELAKALDGMELSKYGGYARVVATVGHRAVVVIGSRERKLSDNVENVDPAYRKVGKISVAVKGFKPYIRWCEPLDGSEEAKATAELVNEFIKKAIEILDKHPVNKEREARGELKANAILLRDAGGVIPKVELISKRYGLKFAAVAEMPVEIGIARILGMEVAKVPPPTEDKKSDYEIRVNATLNLLKKADVVYVHLKGPDEPGHDGNRGGKVKAIEDIDRYYVARILPLIDLDEVAILITSDHATPPTVGAHTDDPVPLALIAPNLEPDKTTKLTERECSAKGELRTIEHGWELLPKVLKLIKG